MSQIDKYQSIFETTIDGIIVITNRGIIEEINSAALKLFGYEREEVVGNNVKMLMGSPHHANHDGYIHNYEKTRKAKIIGIGREVEGLKQDGTTFPFRLAVSEFGSDGDTFYTGIIHDLTLQKQNEAYIKKHSEKLEYEVEERTKMLQSEIELKQEAQVALQESQKLYETIAVNFPNGTITVLDLNFGIVFIEGSELQQLGFGTKRLVGENYISLLSEDIQSLVKTKISEVYNGKEQTFEFEIQNKTYRARCVPLYNAEGKIDQILLVENNVTKEKRAEQEIYNALEKERQLNELKTRFVSMASHEFRTPLSSILSSSNLIERYPESDQQENRLKHLGKIKKNVHNLNMILNDFLSVEKIEGGILKNNPEELNLTDFIQEVVEEAQPLCKSGQEIKARFNHTLANVNVDPFLFRNSLNNLVSNAIKYSDADIEIVTRDFENGWCAEVVDKGIGISSEDQQNLFNRFYRASNAGNIQGTGLGLNIVKRYAAIMGGEINFDSEIGKGSRFEIRFKHVE